VDRSSKLRSRNLQKRCHLAPRQILAASGELAGSTALLKGNTVIDVGGGNVSDYGQESMSGSKKWSTRASAD
jgi:hypothetical protein